MSAPLERPALATPRRLVSGFPVEPRGEGRPRCSHAPLAGTSLTRCPTRPTPSPREMLDHLRRCDVVVIVLPRKTAVATGGTTPEVGAVAPDLHSRYEGDDDLGTILFHLGGNDNWARRAFRSPSTSPRNLAGTVTKSLLTGSRARGPAASERRCRHERAGLFEACLGGVDRSGTYRRRGSPGHR